MLPSARVTLGTTTCPRAYPVSPKADWNGMIVLQGKPVCTVVAPPAAERTMSLTMSPLHAGEGRVANLAGIL